MVNWARWLGVSIVVAALFAALPAHANSKYAAFVVHADSGDVLLDKYSTEYRYPASLTKMMTLYLLFEEMEAGRLDPTSKLDISARAAGQPASKLGVKAGTTIDVETAIHALAVKSANDVAVVIAEAIAGSEWKFAQQMTARARTIGMRQTTFRNASGLPNRKQLTTARDMATLSRRLIQDFPEYYHYFGAKSFTWNGRTYRTHNALVKTFDGADGLKTGYTRLSGYNLATTAVRDGNRLIGVVLGGRSVRTRDNHMREILEDGFAAINRKPTLIAALHREKPAPRIKPNQLVTLAAINAPAGNEPAQAPTINANTALRGELALAAAAFKATRSGPQDALSALIANTAFSDDFNQIERVKLASREGDDEIGEGDVDVPVDRSWAAQIGAYSSKDRAQKELEAAAIAAGLIDRARLVTPAELTSGKTIYRAQFSQLSEQDAADVCDAVRAAAIACLKLQDAKTRVSAR